jgi:methylthioribose-1-phosphate isomerase
VTFGRLLGFSAAALAVATLLGLGMLLRPDPQLKAPTSKATTTLARTLNESAHARATTPQLDWAVTKATSAQHALVVEVDAERLDQARNIAVEIVEPVRSRGYEEVLIYVRQPGSRIPTVRRIKWTPHGGYVESTYVDQ